MKKVFLSFLGLGKKDKETEHYKYEPTRYQLNGKKSDIEEYLQIAELKLIGTDKFDKVIIVVTDKSYRTHFNKLKEELTKIGVRNIHPIKVDENMSSQGQWRLFEEIYRNIDHGDALTVDVTHGYRSIPIVFSTAINFLQKSKNIKLEAVYYAAFEKNEKLAPIEDLKDFYVINEWAEAVSRLVEDADTRKLTHLVKELFDAGPTELRDPDLTQSLEILTESLRNVDIHHIYDNVKSSLEQIDKKGSISSPTSQVLLDIIKEKFSPLSPVESLSRRYDAGYFDHQLEIIRLLLEHKLFMQAFTAMNELIASLGMIPFRNIKYTNAEGRRKRRYADIFLRMISIKEEKWKFIGDDERIKEKILPFYKELEKLGLINKMEAFIEGIKKYRDGFDHAWTSKKGAPEDIKDKGNEMFIGLKQLIKDLKVKGILNN